MYFLDTNATLVVVSTAILTILLSEGKPYSIYCEIYSIFLASTAAVAASLQSHCEELLLMFRLPPSLLFSAGHLVRIDTQRIPVVSLFSKLGPILIAEIVGFYAWFVYSAPGYQFKTAKYKELKQRQLQLERKERKGLDLLNYVKMKLSIGSKHSPVLDESEWQEFQSNLTILRNLKRAIQRVSLKNTPFFVKVLEFEIWFPRLKFLFSRISLLLKHIFIFPNSPVVKAHRSAVHSPPYRDRRQGHRLCLRRKYCSELIIWK